MSSTEGRSESPPPETQSDAQMGQPASGQDVDKTNTTDKAQSNNDQLKNLTSNPAGPLDSAVKDKFSKPNP